MSTVSKHRLAGFYLLAFAVVFSFIALTLLPAQADDINPPYGPEPVIRDPEIPEVIYPKYDPKDPDLFEGVIDHVKLGDTMTIKLKDTKGLKYVRVGEPLTKKEVNAGKQGYHEVLKADFSKTKTPDVVTLKYTVPCWVKPSANKDDFRPLYALAFFEDGPATTINIDLHPIKGTGKSASLCEGKPKSEPKRDPNYAPEVPPAHILKIMEDYMNGGSSDTPNPPDHPKPTNPSTEPSTPPVVSYDPEVTIKPGEVEQNKTTKFTISKLHKDIASVQINLNDSFGSSVSKLDKFETKGKASFERNINIPCNVAPGKYVVQTVTMDKDGLEKGIQQKELVVKKGKCGTPPPNPTGKPSVKPVAKKPVVTVASASITQKEATKVTVSSLPKDIVTAKLALLDKKGTKVRDLASIETKGNQSVDYTFNAACTIPAGEYKLQLTAMDKNGAVKHEALKALTIKKGKCGTPPPPPPSPKDEIPTLTVKYKDGDPAQTYSRGEKFTVTVANAIDLKSADFFMHSKEHYFGTIANTQAHPKSVITAELAIPCNAVDGKHQVKVVVHTFGGKTTTLAQPINVKGGDWCAVQTNPVTTTSTGGSTGGGTGLAKTGGAAYLMGLLSVLCAAAGIVLLSRKKILS